MGKKRVLIVGGGTSGLAAAYSLLRSKEDIEVVVLEAADRAGGRIAGDEVDGFFIDTGAETFIESYSTVRKLAESLGIPLMYPPSVTGGLIYSKGDFHGGYVGGNLKQRLETLKTLILFRVFSLKAILQMLRFSRMMKKRSKDLSIEDPMKLAAFDTEQSFAAFAENNSLSDYVNEIAHVNIAAYTAASAEEIGAAYGMSVLWNFSLNRAENICLPEKGVGSFATALVRACAEATRVSTPVQRIVIENGAATGVVTESGESIPADAVICAVPATIATRIVPELPADVRDVLSRISYSPVVKVVMGLDCELFPRSMLAALFPKHSGSFLLAVVNFKCVAPGIAPEGKSLLHVLTVGDDTRALLPLSDDAIETKVVGEVRKYFPAMVQPPRFVRVYRWKEALCIPSGGMLRDVQRIRANGLDGVRGLFLAGDYTRVPVSNGALESGIDAADDSLSFLRRMKTEAD
ncbi:MAG: NAD(P)/FAD-dependent oxidoreductase [Alphaproteobacteria bacterium]|nr:NAD(P)/FAD-dependent oxidoreductase [Alphaproteobacteria bacterium]